MDAGPTHRIEIGADHPAFAGHFPGRPVLPGVALVAEVLEAAAADPTVAKAIGAAPQLAVVKFLSPVLPGAVLELKFELGERTVGFSVTNRGRHAATGQFARAGRGVAPDR